MRLQLDVQVLRSRLARRMLLVFVVCALLPVTALTLISWRKTYTELEEYSRDKLHEATKTAGMSLFERFYFAESELRFAADQVQTGRPLQSLHADLERFQGLAHRRDGHVIERFGAVFEPVLPGGIGAERVAAGGAAVSFVSTAEGPPRALVTVLVDGDDASAGHLVGWIDPEYAWGEVLLAGLPGAIELELRAPDGGVLLSTFGEPSGVDLSAAGEGYGRASGSFDWSYGTEDYLGSFWELPLRFAFAVDGVTLLTFERRAEALAAASGYGRVSALTGLTTLWIILLLSIGQIRHNLVPLERLKEATGFIARRDFSHRVEVRSKDEFRDLADSFNAMAGRLDSQFSHLAAVGEIDRAILSSMRMESIVERTITLVGRGYDAEAVAIGMLDPAGERLRVYSTGSGVRSSVRALPEEAVAELTQTAGLIFEPGQSRPPYLGPITDSRAGRIAAFPVGHDAGLSGVLMLRLDEQRQLDEDDVAQLRQIADQVAVALANAKLFEQLQDMKAGALVALARAVDAKSEWTNGHSERVTAMAIELATELGFGEAELEVLHRGGLLHDIGKIGVPNAVLDKPGRLTEEEFDLMKAHPVIGARILEPIPVYADVLPIVRQHHERLDGKGYPDGLRGDQIAFMARITAVADVFDACRSDRPYRAGMPLERVVQIIRGGSGSHFDPVVVDAFERIIAADLDAASLPKAS